MQVFDFEGGFCCNSGFPEFEPARGIEPTHYLSQLNGEAAAGEAPKRSTAQALHATGIAMKRTYQASKVRRARTHGFLVRMKSRGGRAVINARRAKGRKRLAV